jgi:hypothetical protein
VFSTRSVRKLRDAIDLVEAVFSTRSVPRCYKQDSKDVKTEVEGSTSLEAVIRQ